MNTTPSFSIVVPTAYGQMIVNRNDINQTNALVKTGRAIDHHEIGILQIIARAMGDNIEFLDIGANFGVYALGLAAHVGPKGKVHAFEAQRIIFNMLAGSVALNAITNVHCHNVAVGKGEGKIEVPQYDYSKPLNFGSIEFSAQQNEALTQKRSYDMDKVEFVKLVSIDSYCFEMASLIKIDAEGMEIDILDGAAETIKRCRPVMFIEFLKVDRYKLRHQIENFGYAVHESGVNYLCIPHELGARIKVSAALRPPT